MTTTPPISNLDGFDAHGHLISWGALNLRGQWLMNSDHQTWIELTQEAAEESLRHAGAVRVRAGSGLE